MKKEEMILSLIKDNLIHMHLILSLKELGFINEHYYLKLDSTIFELMNVKLNDDQYDIYMDRCEQVIEIDIHNPEQLNNLANDIYNLILSKNDSSGKI